MTRLRIAGYIALGGLALLLLTLVLTNTTLSSSAGRTFLFVLLAGAAIAILIGLIVWGRSAIAAPGPAGWAIIAALIVLTLMYSPLVALLPPEMQVRLLIARGRLEEHWLLVGAVLTVLFILFRLKALAIITGAVVTLAFFLMPGNDGLSSAERVYVWLHGPQAPRQYVVPKSEWGLAVAPTSPCDSREVPYVFEARKPVLPFNRAGQCGPVLWFKGHCVWVQGFNSSTAVKLCDSGDPDEPLKELPLNAEYAWSADGSAFKDKYRLDPPRKTVFFAIVP